MAANDELRIPDEATKDADSFEILRVWIANKGQHVCLRGGVWDNPAYWGMMLADLARHIAEYHHQAEGFDRGEVLMRLKAGFDAEMAEPTDKPSGRLET